MHRSFVCCLFLCGWSTAIAPHAFGQGGGSGDAIRVTVSQNNDGSRTTYEYDTANRKAVGTTIAPNGKEQSKIRYTLDETGRFATGEVFGPNEKFLFKTVYKYDPTGRLMQETQLTKEDVMITKLVYLYDSSGKQAGYSAYDSSGKLIGQTGSANRPISAPPTAAKPARR